MIIDYEKRITSQNGEDGIIEVMVNHIKNPNRKFLEIGWGDGGANRRVQKVLDRLDGGRPLASEQAYIEAVQREFPV